VPYALGADCIACKEQYFASDKLFGEAGDAVRQKEDGQVERARGLGVRDAVICRGCREL
jgi:hypothetical protein